ncbi:MAG: DUF1592 domain-containing protein [Planctomycetota bacterium]|nr:DUF1592 domain-containing protein [Planctomycetota bacterium]
MVYTLLFWTTALSVVGARPQQKAPAQRPDFETEIKPILDEFCYGCHGPRKQKGDIRLDTLDHDLVNGLDAETWNLVEEMVEELDMPPSKAEKRNPLPDASRQKLLTWLDSSLAEAAVAQVERNRTILRRLNKQQYTNSLQELLHLPIDFGNVLPDDGKSEMGFSNNGEVLEASPLHLEYYQAIARQALDQAIVEGPKPAPFWIRVTFGKGSGKGKVAGSTGGYQAVQFPTDDFVIEILDSKGQEKVAVDAVEQKQFDDIKRHISVGLRGSSQSRWRSVEEGVVLYSALPHKEVAPGSWQGPSPNLKLEMQRVFPENGDFEMRVRASRGFLLESTERLLIAIEDPVPLAYLDEQVMMMPRDAHVFAAADAKNIQNMELQGSMLMPVEVPEPSAAEFELVVQQAGYFQLDLVHRPASIDNMPSVRLSLQNLNLDQRLELSEEQLQQERLVTAVGAAYIPAGRHKLKIGGRFFIGFESLVVTPVAEDHPAVAPLQAKSAALAAELAKKVPSMRAFVGTRTDDGMDYANFDRSQEVKAELGGAQVYTFRGRLENLPIPEPESGDTEILSGFMVLGLWNDHLVKSSRDPGPPILIEAIEFEAPFHEEWPPASHSRIFFASANQGNEEVYAREVIGSFIRRAFRRPVDGETLERYMAFWHNIRLAETSFEDSIKEVLIAALCSPNFLYLVEPETISGGEGLEDPWPPTLSEHALATRLSYFLWNSPPDERLTRLAADKKLRGDLGQQVTRLLDDERSWRFVRSFTHEWLRLDRQQLITMNVNSYPTYTRFVKRDMAEETYHFVEHLIANDMSIFNLIDSDFVMLNQNLAEFYGIEGVVGNHFRAVPMPASEGRGGLLSQGAFLAGHSDGNEAHPIKRAVWVKQKILGDDPPLPPPNVPPLDSETPGFENLTLKEKLVKHRDNPSCHDCHADIDPFGVVFENYNAVGLMESERKGRPIDTTTVLPSGTPIAGVPELKAHLLDKERDTFARALIEHMFTYALGRDVSFADEAEIDAILDFVREREYSMRSVILGIVQSESFRIR